MKGLAMVWRDIATQVSQGERDEARLIDQARSTIIADVSLTAEAVRTLAAKRVRDMIASAVKPAGKTSRVPAGQQDLGWADLAPVLAIDRLREQIKRAYRSMERARRHAEILGVIDASLRRLVRGCERTRGADRGPSRVILMR